MSFGDFVGRAAHELSDEEDQQISLLGASGKAPLASKEPQDDDHQVELPELDLSGVWVVDKSRSFPLHDLLKAMGVSWVSRKLYPSDTTMNIQQRPVLSVHESGAAFNHHAEIPLDGKPHELRDVLGDAVTTTAYLDQETRAVIIETDYPRRLGGSRTVDIRQLSTDGSQMVQEIQLWAEGSLAHVCRRTWLRQVEDKPTTYDGLLAGMGQMRLSSKAVRAALRERPREEVLCSVYENQRWQGGPPGRGGAGGGSWSGTHLTPGDHVSRWSDEWDQPSESRDQINASLPAGWVWLGPWRVDMGHAQPVAGSRAPQKVVTDAEGWSFAREFPSQGSGGHGRRHDWFGRPDAAHQELVVRRRRWVRVRAPANSPAANRAGADGGGDAHAASAVPGEASAAAQGAIAATPDDAIGVAGASAADDEDEAGGGIASYMIRREKARKLQEAQEQAARMNAAIAPALLAGVASGAPGQPSQRELALEAENQRLAGEGQQFLIQLIQQKQANQELRQQLLQLMAGERDEADAATAAGGDEEPLAGSPRSRQFPDAAASAAGGRPGQSDDEADEDSEDEDDDYRFEKKAAAAAAAAEASKASAATAHPAVVSSKAQLREQLAQLREQTEAEMRRLKAQLKKRKVSNRRLKKQTALLENNCRAYEERLAEYDRDYLEMANRMKENSSSHNKMAQDSSVLRDENIRLSRIVEDLRLEGLAFRSHNEKMVDLVRQLTEDKQQMALNHLQEIDHLKLSIRQQISERTHHLHTAMKEARRQQGVAQDQLAQLQSRADLRISQLEESNRENLRAVTRELQRAHQIAAEQIAAERKRKEQAEADLEAVQLQVFAAQQDARRLQAALQEARRERDEALRQAQTLTDMLGAQQISDSKVLELEAAELRHRLAESDRERRTLMEAAEELAKPAAGQGGIEAELAQLRAERLWAQAEHREEVAKLRLQLHEARQRAEEAEESEAGMAALLREIRDESPRLP